MESKSTALIVVDMNRAHLDMKMNYLPVSPGEAQRILGNVSRIVIPLFRKFGCPVIFVQTAHRVHPQTGEPFSLASPFWKFQMEKTVVAGVGKKRETRAILGSPVTELMPELDVHPGDPIVVKQRYSPFLGTDLDAIIRILGIRTVFLAGVNTNNCVLCTAFEAFNRDLRVIVLEDCCASMNGTQCHDMAIQQIRTSLGWVIQTDQIEAILKGETDLG